MDSTELKKRMSALGVYGRVALMPKHYVKALFSFVEKGLQVFVQPVKQDAVGGTHMQVEWKLDKMNTREHSDIDLALCRMARTIPLFKDIRKHIWTEDDIQSRGPAADGVVVVPPNIYISIHYRR